MTIVPSAPFGVTGMNTVDMGIGIASVEAFGLGAVPDPENISEFPPRGWVWRRRAVVVDNSASGGLTVTEINVDLKGRRLVDEGVLYLVTTNTNINGVGFSVSGIGNIRVLLTLP